MDWGQLAMVVAAFALKAALYLTFFFAMLILTIKLCFRKSNRERRNLAGFQLDDIDRMSGEAFEEYLGALFDRLGYLSSPTERFDKGADLILVKEGVRTAVQAKCWTRERVGVEAIRAVVAAQRPYRCTRGLVVTNGHFTRPATQAAKDNNIALWDRDDLANVILTRNNPGQPPTARPVASPSAITPPSASPSSQGPSSPTVRAASAPSASISSSSSTSSARPASSPPSRSRRVAGLTPPPNSSTSPSSACTPSAISRTSRPARSATISARPCPPLEALARPSLPAPSPA